MLDISKERFARDFLATLKNDTPTASTIAEVVACLDSKEDVYGPFRLVYSNWVALKQGEERSDDNA